MGVEGGGIQSRSKQRLSPTSARIFALTFKTHADTYSQKTHILPVKGTICVENRPLFDTAVALLALVEERRSRDVLISIVISSVMLGLHA